MRHKVCSTTAWCCDAGWLSTQTASRLGPSHPSPHVTAGESTRHCVVSAFCLVTGHLSQHPEEEQGDLPGLGQVCAQHCGLAPDSHNNTNT